MRVTKRKSQDFYINSVSEMDLFIQEVIAKGCLKTTSFEYVYDELKHIEDISVTKLISLTNKIISNKFPKKSSCICMDYYIYRGHSEEVAKIEISKHQRARSKRCKEYWIKFGYSEQEALLMVNTYQKESSVRGNAPRTKEYWIELGNTEEESIILARKNSGENSSWCVEYWMKLGYSEEESKDIISKNQKHDLLYFKNKYGEELGTEKYFEINIKKARHGPDNGQFGKPSPKGSGHGISGHYKQYYFRSTFEYFAIKLFENSETIFQELDVAKAKIIVRLPDNKNYRPDFLINNDTIVEVKPSGLITNETVLLKKKCCLEQFPQFKYQFMTEHDLNIDMSILREDVDNGIVIIDKGKQIRYNKNIK